ncbi:17797_t:CDS:1, partial [Cetraspora pellucida]
MPIHTINNSFNAAIAGMFADMFPETNLIDRHGKEIRTRGNVKWRKAKLQFSAADKECLNSDHSPKIAVDIDVEAALQKFSQWALTEPELYESIRNIISLSRDSIPTERVCEFIRKMQIKKHMATLLTNDQEMELNMSNSYASSERAIKMGLNDQNNQYMFTELPNILISVEDWTIIEACDIPICPLDYPNYLCLSHVPTASERSNIAL